MVLQRWVFVLRVLYLPLYSRLSENEDPRLFCFFFLTWLAGNIQGSMKRFQSHPESSSRISNLVITEPLYSNRGSLYTRTFRRLHLFVFRYRLNKMALRTRNVSGTFERRVPAPVLIFLIAIKHQPSNGCNTTEDQRRGAS